MSGKCNDIGEWLRVVSECIECGGSLTYSLLSPQLVVRVMSMWGKLLCEESECITDMCGSWAFTVSIMRVPRAVKVASAEAGDFSVPWWVYLRVKACK